MGKNAKNSKKNKAMKVDQAKQALAQETADVSAEAAPEGPHPTATRETG